MPRIPPELEAFVATLREHADGAKLEKALARLRADRFQLFADVAEDGLVGVVKSQGNADLVYACRLGADGGFCCCTQNLNACGGLRGSVCKHILVLVIGLRPPGIADWVSKSKDTKASLDRDAASAIFIRHKGAEAGEVDWRPTETVPEDFYGF